MRGSLLAGAIVLAAVSASWMASSQAAGPPMTLPEAVAAGAKLFSDPSLGTSGQSCDTCHTRGGEGEKGFAGKEIFPKLFMGMKVVTLDQAIQMCITGPLKGKALAWDDPRLTDLAAYVQSVYLKKK